MNKIILICTFLMLILLGCSDDKEKDMTYPVIQMDGDAFPKDCDKIQRGKTFTFKATFTDNQELGSYSLDFHNNFDHHSHSSDDITCDDMEPNKAPVKPWTEIKSYPIPNSLMAFDAAVKIEVPADIDLGDYHLTVRLVDKTGWQTVKGISIKVIE